MRIPVIAGNWKCHTRLETARMLALELKERIEGVPGIQKVLCPPFVYIPEVLQAIKGSSIGLGAQDVYWADDVAATGEVGPQMLVELVSYVIIGHSERRHQMGETDEAVNRKVKAALSASLTPIMCVGETQEEREMGATEAVLVRQTRAGLDGADLPDGYIIAYEPVWAIGTGIAATGDDAASAIAVVRREVARLFGEGKAETIRILYGGSVTPDNIADLMSREGIDGALVGGASLKAESFSAIVEGAARQAEHEPAA